VHNSKALRLLVLLIIRAQAPLSISKIAPSALSAEPKHFPPLRWLINQRYLLLSLTSLFWAANIVLARFVAGHVPPMTLSSVRWIGAFILLWPFAKEHLRRDWPALRAHLPLMLLFSAGGLCLQQRGSRFNIPRR
jgi:EamA-like transporter family